MIKLVYCITKKASITDQEFFHYWKDIHGPIGARIPGLRKLVQSHRYDVSETPSSPIMMAWQNCGSMMNKIY